MSELKPHKYTVKFRNRCCEICGAINKHDPIHQVSLQKEPVQVEQMSEDELDTELILFGIDPDELISSAFNKVCSKLRETSSELAQAKQRIVELEQELWKWLQACDKAESSPDWEMYKSTERLISDLLLEARKG
jgi:hypothetical protein